MLYWTMRFLNSDMYFGFHEYPEDQVILYDGLFGIPRYMIWWARSWPDKPSEVELYRKIRLMAWKSKPSSINKEAEGSVNFVDDFIIKSIEFDVTKEMYRVFAVSQIYNLLDTKRSIGSYSMTKKGDGYSGIQLIKILLNVYTNKIYEVKSSIKKKEILKKYYQITFDPSLSLLDIISKICNENRWEFYLGPKYLYIGRGMYSSKSRISPVHLSKTDKKEMSTKMYRNITLDAMLAQPLSVHSEINSKEIKARTLWSRYFLNNQGTSVNVMMMRKYNNKFLNMNERAFVKTLTPRKARQYGLMRLNKPYKSDPIILGKVFDDFEAEHKDNYKAFQFKGDTDTFSKDKNKHTFKDKSRQHKRQVDEVKMTTPYAGDGVGMLFPQGESYRTLFSPYGERDEALVGPAYYGPKDEVPVRTNVQDFRLQLPGDIVLYGSKSGGLWMFSKGTMRLSCTDSGTSDKEITNVTNVSPAIEIKDDGTVLIKSTGGNEIEISSSGITIKGTEVKALDAPTFKITPSGVKIIGNLTVNGIKANTVDGDVVKSKGGTIVSKLPPQGSA